MMELYSVTHHCDNRMISCARDAEADVSLN